MRAAILVGNPAMTERQEQSRFQRVALTYFPMFIAALSLCTSIYNGYLNNKFVDLIQNNTAVSNRYGPARKSSRLIFGSSSGWA